ncbi:MULTISPECIES: hypothetical protein [unclassified Bradyrhizobium]|uniref:hypothetical protein n=1 Tax=unclassified Bradyrhizobium TaxID=2631580 RepID=UPI001FFA9006|nr:MULTISPECIES: hypothetical protein [unclassified Bradyrhizobium]MCK1297181.1 hypothetical protein [Bradyrhizobium sp. 37]MCK1769186.1 hypothetical protein [Bradyrhizobium sp. 134]
MEQDHIDKAIVENYRKLRTRMGALTAAFPVVVIVTGLLWEIRLQPSLSDYYFAQTPAQGVADLYPVRLWFCGLLFAVGVFLYRYTGFSKNEDRWLSLTGAFVLGVAIFPMGVSGKTSPFTLASFGLPNVTLHDISAVLAFICIGIIIFWYSDSTLSKLKKDGAARKWFRRAYFLIGAYMLLAMAGSVIMHFLHTDRENDSYILYVEWSGLWAFAIYWFVKNWELRYVAESIRKGTTAASPMGHADVVDAL